MDKATPTESARARRAGFANNQKVFFITELNGQRRSSGYRIRKNDTVYNEIPARLVETHQRFDMVSKDGYRISQDVIRKDIVDARTGAALYESERTEMNGEIVTRTISIFNGVATFSDDSVQNKPEETVPVPEGVMFTVDTVWLAQQNPDIGDTFTKRFLTGD